jgi:predicted RNA-binding protein with PUA-like domain
MARAKRYWLFKSEPDVFSIQDLERAPGQTTYWEGVRNYQARNLLRDDMKKGDGVLYYHSRVQPIGVAGLAVITKGGYPDPDQFDAQAKYHDPKSDPDDPRWYCVDIKHVETFDGVVTLQQLKDAPKLADMMVVQKGARLSVQPVTKAEYETVVKMGRALSR